MAKCFACSRRARKDVRCLYCRRGPMCIGCVCPCRMAGDEWSCRTKSGREMRKPHAVRTEPFLRIYRMAWVLGHEAGRGEP